MLIAKFETLRSTLLDNLSDTTALAFAKFAKSEIKLTKHRGTRYLIKRIEEALEFCCDHPEAFHLYPTITEARKKLRQNQCQEN